ncbi:hypothetical protein [Luteimonas notoginsengisoli]|uniref:Uncharacterized protein n=1 Tax=Luteimonas notoginsengisoli TaxID=1578200 RepID=A0ABV7UVB7_9GAMM
MAEQALRRYLSAIAAQAAPRRLQHPSMSTIGSSDPHLTRAGLDRLDGRVSLDELRGRDQGTGAGQLGGLEQLRGTAPDVRAPSADAGEDVLNAAAWDGVPAGLRMLAGDHGFEARLGAMELSSAADSAADAILSAIG